MKKKALALALCISMAAVMFTGCKTVVQNPTGTTPQDTSVQSTTASGRSFGSTNGSPASSAAHTACYR